MKFQERTMKMIKGQDEIINGQRLKDSQQIMVSSFSNGKPGQSFKTERRMDYEWTLERQAAYIKLR